jgi:Na+/melibiose symporter-like transporter
MELNELKDRAQKRGLPDRQFRDALASSQGLSGFIGRLKAEDQREQKSARRMMLFSVGAGIFYVLIFVLTWIAPPDESPDFHRFILSAFGLLFLSVALVSRKKSNELAGIDYAQPIGSFLRSVERRYKPFNMRDAALAVIFIAAFSVTGALGWLNAKNRYFPSMDQSTALILYGCIVVAALVVGLVVAVSQWKKRKAPLLGQVKRMIADLERPASGPANGDLS